MAEMGRYATFVFPAGWAGESVDPFLARGCNGAGSAAMDSAGARVKKILATSGSRHPSQSRHRPAIPKARSPGSRAAMRQGDKLR